MIVRNSPRVPQPSAGEGREHSVRSRPKHHLACRGHGLVGPEADDMRFQNLSDQLADGSGRIFTQIEVNGRVGLFEFFAFHAQPDSQGR